MKVNFFIISVVLVKIHSTGGFLFDIFIPHSQGCHSDRDCTEAGWWCDDVFYGIRCLMNHSYSLFSSNTKMCCCTDIGSLFPSGKCSTNVLPKHDKVTTTTASPGVTFPTIQPCDEDSDCSIMYCDYPWVLKCAINKFFYIPYPGSSCICTEAVTGLGLRNPLAFPKYKTQNSTVISNYNNEGSSVSEGKFPTMKGCNSQSDCDLLQCPKPWDINCIHNHFFLPGSTCACTNATSGEWNMYVWPRYKNTQISTTNSTYIKVTHSQSSVTTQRLHTPVVTSDVAKSTTTQSTQQSTTSTTINTTTSSGFRCHQCGSEEYPCSSQQLFDRSIQPSLCPGGDQYCMTDVHQRDGGIFVYKRCVSKGTCIREWLQETSHLAYCMGLQKVKMTGSFDCHFCCQTEGCNSGVVPSNDTFFLGRDG